jgi:uncharacterized delta-60 repeat protein
MNRSRLLTFVSALAISVVFMAPSSSLASYGDLDATFGSGGKFRIPKALSGGQVALQVQADGKILVAMQMRDYDDEGPDIVFRLTKSGVLDKDFGDQGRSRAAGQEHIDGMEILGDGRIALLKRYFAKDANGEDIPDTETSRITVLAPDGRPDRSFAATGTLDLGGRGSGLLAKSFAVQEGSKLLVSGSQMGSKTTTSVMRLNLDGTADQTFGVSGTMTIGCATVLGSNLTDAGSSQVAAANGAVFLGVSCVDPIAKSSGVYDRANGILKFTRDGTLVTDFGVGGIALGRSQATQISSIDVATNGNILALGDYAVMTRRGGQIITVANYLNAAGGDAYREGFALGPDDVVALRGGGFALSDNPKFSVIRSDFSILPRFNGSTTTAVYAGSCGMPGQIDESPDGSIVSLGWSSPSLDCENRGPYSATVVRMLGPAGGRAAPYVRLTEPIDDGSNQPPLRTIRGVGAPASSLKKVYVAIQRVDRRLLEKKRRCRWLSMRGSRTITNRASDGRCTNPHFVPVSGRTKWKYTLRRQLPIGRYRIYARGKTADGVVTPADTYPDNYVSFRAR